MCSNDSVVFNFGLFVFVSTDIPFLFFRITLLPFDLIPPDPHSFHTSPSSLSSRQSIFLLPPLISLQFILDFYPYQIRSFLFIFLILTVARGGFLVSPIPARSVAWVIPVFPCTHRREVARLSAFVESVPGPVICAFVCRLSRLQESSQILQHLIRRCSLRTAGSLCQTPISRISVSPPVFGLNFRFNPFQIYCLTLIWKHIYLVPDFKSS